ncbi:MAG: TadE/TadG family type IV pilus assembly protein [Planctomycetales bacterium]
MQRAILIAWIPCLLWLVGSFAAAWLVLRISGARLAWSRLRRLHRCEAGSVQTLSFVITLPIFIMLVLLIVQISQLMIGIAVVEYAAYAAARAAIVWMPAEMPNEPANRLDPVSIDGGTTYPAWRSRTLVFRQMPPDGVWKYRKIWSAAALACVPISPSHRYLKKDALARVNSQTAEVTNLMYQKLAPQSARNPKIPDRIRNKAAYAAEHTWIVIDGVDRDSHNGPTYNPHPGHYRTRLNPNTGQIEPLWIPWKPHEVGWEDAVTVWVNYRFALLPGPGRYLSPAAFLSTPLKGSDGTKDQVSKKVKVYGKQQNPDYEQDIYWVELNASATLSNEGLKSVMPYVVPAETIN